METKIENLSHVLDFIQSKPDEAQARTRMWQDFVKKHPIAITHQKIENFIKWGQKEGIDNQTLQGLWLGKEIELAYSLTKTHGQPPSPAQNPTTNQKGSGLAGGLLSLAASPLVVLGLGDKTKLIEEDKDYKKIAEGKIWKWRGENLDKDFTSKEWLDYQYGSLEDNKGPALEEKKMPPALKQEAEQEFRNNKKYAGRVKKYDREKKKVYSKVENDQAVKKIQSSIQEEANARYEALKHTENVSRDDILKRVKQKRWEEFAQKHQEKTNAYKGKHEDIKNAYDRLQTKKELLKYKEATGKAVKPVEKIHRPTPSMTNEEASARLETAFKPPPSPSGLVFSAGWGEPKPKPKFMEGGKLQPTPILQTTHSPSALSRTPTPSPFTRALNKGLGGGINGINRLAARGPNFTKPLSGLTNLAGQLASQLGSKIVSTAAKAVLSNPELWAPILAVVLILILTFSLIGFVGAPGGGAGTPTITPSPPEGGGGDIANCTFYRSGDSTPGLKIGNPNMASLISSISSTVGVPASIIAGIMRVETGSALASTDQSYLDHDYDAHTQSSPPYISFGVMQFTPGTFINTFNANKSAMANDFGKTSATTNIDPPNNMAPQNVLRIYSVRDSIIAAAFKVKGDKNNINGNGPWDKTTVYEIARRYYGRLSYPGGNYGDNLWKSFSQCQPSTPPPPETTITPPPGMDMFKGNSVFYCQDDSRWNPPTNGCYVYHDGCGPTSVAMVTSSFGVSYDPLQMSFIFKNVGAKSCNFNDESNTNYIEWLKNNGFEVDELQGSGPFDFNEAKKYIDNGFIIIGSSQNAPCPPSPAYGCASGTTSISHIFVIDGVDVANSTIAVLDPINCVPGGSSEITTSGRFISGTFPFYYALAVKKK